MEKYITENLESILSIPESEALEIFVVDDGGTDDTLKIAKEYQKQYPTIVYAVHKENGGYGSVQNYSIRNATGLYFKIIDGDDWVDGPGLSELVRYLYTATEDVIITNYMKGPDKKTLRKVSLSSKLATSDIPIDDIRIPIGMWALTYKTRILREVSVQLPEHTLYTDRIYSTIPFEVADSIKVLPNYVYCYRTGRDGQSVSRESRIKHIDEYLHVTKAISTFYEHSSKRQYVLLKCSAAYKVSIRALLLLPRSEKAKQKIIEYERTMKKDSPDVYKKAASLKTRMGWIISFLRATRYSGYTILSILPKKVIDF